MVKICPKCKKLLSTLESKCPICGNENLVKICEKCEKIVPNNLIVCPVCKDSSSGITQNLPKKTHNSIANKIFITFSILLFFVIILVISLFSFKKFSPYFVSKEKLDNKIETNEEQDESEEYWEILNFMDEFGEETSDRYIFGTAWGEFSNSATTGSQLLVGIQITKDYIGFGLFEYGDQLVKNSYSNAVDYDIVMRVEDGTKTNLYGRMYSGDKVVRIVDKFDTFGKENVDKVITALLFGTGSIDFYIKESDRPTTTYLFSIEIANFLDLYKIL